MYHTVKDFVGCSYVVWNCNCCVLTCTLDVFRFGPRCCPWPPKGLFGGTPVLIEWFSDLPPVLKLSRDAIPALFGKAERHTGTSAIVRVNNMQCLMKQKLSK